MANFGRHRAVRDAVGRPVVAPIRARQPQLARKYLNPLHLAIGLKSDERAAVMIHHYDFLATRFPPVALGTIFAQGMCVCTRETVVGQHRVDLIFSHPTDNEGELTLNYTLDGVLLSICSFTFAPGSLVAAQDETIIAVTLIEGVRANLDSLKGAMRTLCGVSPAMIFGAVLAGIAGRFGISTLAGVAASAHPARDATNEAAFAQVYDLYFENIGGVQATSIFYRIGLPRLEKPLAEVKRNRARTRAQREIRAGIAVSAGAACT
ncbi:MULTISPECIES: DUF535 family protein [Sphingosinicellaceae]|uniref:DUF535 family protein n=1 Tax=Sphingosinicellaceae TaxID=2820280 RepID=UPI001C1E568F|nr:MULTISPECIES: DUF535 family protein [Polymorphobacter]QYE33483.1 VirK/YbjX family protein [Polymorphobacter sp. PAMC 29334]UAJ12846.1 VirK/YbjX family protein [Polymorphobacter megasporae]